MQLAIDACALPRDEAHHKSFSPASAPALTSTWRWTVRLEAQGGKLVPVLASDTDRPEMTEVLTVWGDRPCNRAALAQGLDYFISDTAKTPFPPKKGEELWVEVTVPPMGPPRPIQLAIGENGAFMSLKLQ